MNKKWKAKWIEALKSGRYKQGQEELRSYDGTLFCCLGVLADLVGPKEWNDHCGGIYFLSPKIAKKTELDHVVQIDLAELNDHIGADFYDIAIYIKENL